MAVPHSAPSTGAEMNMVQFNENRSSWMGERELRLKDHSASSVGAGAALRCVDSKEQERGHVRSTDDSLLGERQHPEEQEPSAWLPLSEKIRLSILHIQKRQQELSELSRKLKERREVSPQIKENLKVVLGLGQPAGHELEEQLGQSLNPEIPEEEKDGGEKLSLAPSSVTADGLSHVQKEDVLQASQGGEPKTSCSVSEAGDTLQPPCTPAAMVGEAEVPAAKAAEDQNDPEDEDTLESAAPRVSTEHLTLDLVPTQKFQEWSSILSCLRHRIKSLLAQNRFLRLQEQRLQESHVAWHRLAKNLAYQLDPGQHSDGDPEKEIQSLDSSAELNEQEEVVEVISDSVAELPFLDTGLALAQLPQENHLDTAIPAKEPAVSPGPEGTGRAGDRIERAGDVEIARVGDGIAGAVNIEIAGGGEVEIAGPRKDGIVGAGDVEIARAGDVMIAGAGDVMIAGAGDVGIAGAGNAEIAGAGDPEIAGAGDAKIAGAGDVEIAGAEDVKIAGARDIMIAGAGDSEIAVTGEVGKAWEQEARKVLRVFTAVMNIKARMCALLWAAFQKWRATILSLRRSIRDLLSRKDPGRSEGQSHQDPAEGREMAEHLGLQLCPELDLQASVGMKSPHKTEAEAPAEPRDAPRGPQFLSLPEPAAALKQTAIQGCSRGAWPADSPALRLIMQRSLLIQPRRMLLL